MYILYKSLCIGRYAFHCGNTNAVHHFSTKLQFPMKESSVRKFKKLWMEKNGVDIMTTNRSDDEDGIYVNNLEFIHGEITSNKQMSMTSTTIQIGIK